MTTGVLTGGNIPGTRMAGLRIDAAWLRALATGMFTGDAIFLGIRPHAAGNAIEVSALLGNEIQSSFLGNVVVHPFTADSSFTGDAEIVA